MLPTILGDLVVLPVLWAGVLIALVLDVTEVIEDVISKQRQFAATGIRYGQQAYHTSLVGTLEM